MKTSQIMSAVFAVVLTFTSCVKDSLGDPGEPIGGIDPPDTEITDIQELVIPQGFNFQTEKEVNLTITDNENGTRYVVLVGGVEVANKIVIQEGISASFNIPATSNQLTLLRRTAHSLEKTDVSVSGNTAVYNHSN